MHRYAFTETTPQSHSHPQLPVCNNCHPSITGTQTCIAPQAQDNIHHGCTQHTTPNSLPPALQPILPTQCQCQCSAPPLECLPQCRCWRRLASPCTIPETGARHNEAVLLWKPHSRQHADWHARHAASHAVNATAAERIHAQVTGKRAPAPVALQIIRGPRTHAPGTPALAQSTPESVHPRRTAACCPSM